jgi:hypothetical protein
MDLHRKCLPYFMLLYHNRENLTDHLFPQIEGTLTCVPGIFAYVAIVDFPEVSPKSWHFLYHREAAFVVARIEHDRADVKTEPLTRAHT